MGHDGSSTMRPDEIFHQLITLSLVLSLYVAMVSALWWGGWLRWVTGWGVLNILVSSTVLFGPYVSLVFAIAALLFAWYQAARLGQYESLWQAIPALLLTLLTFKWFFDHWAAN